MVIITRSTNSIRDDLSNKDAATGMNITGGVRGAIIGRLNAASGSDVNRYIVLGWLFGFGEPISTKALKEDWQWEALYRWIGFYQEDGEWKIDPMFQAEFGKVLVQARQDFGLTFDALDKEIESFAKGAQNGSQVETGTD